MTAVKVMVMTILQAAGVSHTLSLLLNKASVIEKTAIILHGCHQHEASSDDLDGP